MQTSVMTQIEQSFHTLTLSEQLCVIERLVHQMHINTLQQQNNYDESLRDMAADPDIQRELKMLNGFDS